MTKHSHHTSEDTAHKNTDAEHVPHKKEASEYIKETHNTVEDIHEDDAQKKANQEAIRQELLEEIERQKNTAHSQMNAKKEDADFDTNERLRMMADMENFKKRLLREQEEQAQYLTEKVISSLVPALDNLSLALQYGKGIPEAKDFYMGVEMTHKLLIEELRVYGFAEAGVVGEEFSPAIHEAVGVGADANAQPNTVVQVLQVGYTLNGRTLRPAKVMIAQ